jgi:hypothetical protein
MHTLEQKKQMVLAPCLPLRFLVQAGSREVSRRQMPGMSDSAVFHRLHSLLWTLREPEAIELLSENEQEILARFTRVFESLPWRVIPAYPHISELPDNDLTPLIPTGAQLFDLLQQKVRDFDVR